MGGMHTWLWVSCIPILWMRCCRWRVCRRRFDAPCPARIVIDAIRNDWDGGAKDSAAEPAHSRGDALSMSSNPSCVRRTRLRSKTDEVLDKFVEQPSRPMTPRRSYALEASYDYDPPNWKNQGALLAINSADDQINRLSWEQEIKSAWPRNRDRSATKRAARQPHAGGVVERSVSGPP
jgi:hypothetical protein